MACGSVACQMTSVMWCWGVMMRASTTVCVNEIKTGVEGQQKHGDIWHELGIEEKAGALTFSRPIVGDCLCSCAIADVNGDAELEDEETEEDENATGSGSWWIVVVVDWVPWMRMWLETSVL